MGRHTRNYTVVFCGKAETPQQECIDITLADLRQRLDDDEIQQMIDRAIATRGYTACWDKSVTYYAELVEEDTKP